MLKHSKLYEELQKRIEAERFYRWSFYSFGIIALVEIALLITNL